MISRSGPRGDGQQRGLAVPAGDREDQESVIPEPDVGNEHREEGRPQQQERGRDDTVHQGGDRSAVGGAAFVFREKISNKF